MQPIRTALLAVDLSTRSAKVLAAAVRFLQPLPDSRIVVLHVISDYEAALGAYAGASGLSTGQLEELQGKLEQGAEQQLAAVVADWPGDWPEPILEVRRGAPWSEIVAAAMHHRAELVFLGAHFQDLPKHKVLGDVVSRVTRQVDCPVMVVPTSEE